MRRMATRAFAQAVFAYSLKKGKFDGTDTDFALVYERGLMIIFFILQIISRSRNKFPACGKENSKTRNLPDRVEKLCVLVSNPFCWHFLLPYTGALCTTMTLGEAPRRTAPVSVDGVFPAT